MRVKIARNIIAANFVAIFTARNGNLRRDLSIQPEGWIWALFVVANVVVDFVKASGTCADSIPFMIVSLNG